MKALILISLVSLSSSVGLAQSEEEKKIRELWDVFEQVYDEGDAAAVAMLYAEDADRIDIRGKIRRGRNEIEAHYAAAASSHSSVKDRTGKHALRACLGLGSA